MVWKRQYYIEKELELNIAQSKCICIQFIIIQQKFKTWDLS